MINISHMWFLDFIQSHKIVYEYIKWKVKSNWLGANRNGKRSEKV